MQRGRPCGAQSGGNVQPVTPLDRHTGRVAPAASADPMLVDKAPDARGASPHPAGSRDADWRPPPWGSGEGGPPAAGPVLPLTRSPGDLNFRSYSQTNCSTQTSGDDDLCLLEELTKALRHKLARRHRGKSRHADIIGDLSRAHWHRCRARGQEEKFARARACESEEFVLLCHGCGHQHKMAIIRCGNIRLCKPCRRGRGRSYRRMIRSARKAILHATRGLRSRGRHGRWTEKFFTLTLRHSGNVIHVPVCRLKGPGSGRFFQPRGTTRFSGSRDHLSG